MRAFVIVWVDKIKFVLLQLNQRQFTGTMTIEINFRDGGIASMHSNIKEQVKIV